jgi:CHAT domain/AAA ATPase domain
LNWNCFAMTGTARLVASQGLLELYLKGPRREDARAFGEAEAGTLRDIADRYRRALRNRSSPEAKDGGGLGQPAGIAGALIAIGESLMRWLEADGRRWLSRLLDDGPRPLLVGFEAGRDPDVRARALLEAPWELLLHPERREFLAQDSKVRFTPFRRQGRPTSPPPPPPFRLGSLFMAAAPEGQRELAFEAEENALLAAVGTRAEIEVEDTGELDRLAHRLGELEAIQIVHLSCHGTDDKRATEKAPALFLEDELGLEQPVSTGDLANALAAKPPRLLFLSACLTAAGDADSPDPLVSALVASGFSACLGWAGSVLDPEATRFATELYQPLADGVPLEQAVARAMQTLLLSNPPSSDWHLARLWLGADGGGPLVGAQRKERRIITASAGYKEMLDKRVGKSPVASREEFVGRRRELKEALRVLERADHAGILIHGMGRLGKSSLAARIANRLEHRLRRAVLFEQYDAGTLIEELRAASPSAAAWLADNQFDPADPLRLELALRALFEGPLGLTGYKGLPGEPVLLIIDDAEQMLEDPKAGAADPETIHPDHQPMLRALLRALDPARTSSRLLVTSRYRFRLPDGRDDLAHKLLYSLQPRPMHSAALAKIAHRAAPTGEAALRDRAVGASVGNPGLLAILAPAVANDPKGAPGLLAEMEAHLTKGADASDPRLAAWATCARAR